LPTRPGQVALCILGKFIVFSLLLC